MQLERPGALDLAYTRTMMGFVLFNAAPDTLAMIGLGGGSLAKFCYRHLPATRIKVVEINPHVIALREAFQVPPDDQRFAVQCGDGADWVRFAPYNVDVLMVDGFDYEGQPPALCSQRFYDDCHDALQPNGLLVVNLHSGHKDLQLHIARLARAFADQLLIVGDEDCSNTIVFACKGLLLQRSRHSLLRKPAGFEPAAWEELRPALAKVTAALARLRQPG
jgi:spermidine synthase